LRLQTYNKETVRCVYKGYRRSLAHDIHR
jgi:hypothetical protein